MKVKTSITLSETILEQIDSLAGESSSRSAFVEKVLSDFIKRKEREERDARDAAIYEKYADELSAEALDVLEYQVIT